MTNTIYSINDGVQYTVSDLMAEPLAIAEPIVNWVTEWDITNYLFRNAGPNQGSVVFERGVAPFTEDGLEEVAETATIPATRAVGGTKVMDIAHKLGRALEISYEMRDFNRMQQVQTSIDQLRNAAALSNSLAFEKALDEADVESVQAAAPWGETGSNLIKDVGDAIRAVKTSKVPGQDHGYYGNKPTVMIMPDSLTEAFNEDEKTLKLYSTQGADRHPFFRDENFRADTGATFRNLRIVTPLVWPEDKILILDPARFGFYSDARPLGMQGPIDKPENELVRYQLTQMRVLGVQNPAAGVWLTGVA